METLAVLSLALALLLPAASALANVAANTQIFTEAELTYEDGTLDPVTGAPNKLTHTASVTVTVSLVPGIAVLSDPGPQNVVYSQTDTESSYQQTVTAGGNGPDNYVLDLDITGASNATGYSVEVQDSGGTVLATPHTVALGATVTAQGSTTLNLVVPYDGSTDGVVNGIEAGDTVVVDLATQEVHTVKEVTEDAATNSATIVLDTNISSAPGEGVSIWERKTFNMKVLSGTITDAGSSIILTATSSVTNSAGTSQVAVDNTYTSGAAVLTKFARNLTNAGANTGGTGGRSFTVNGATATYYTGGITAGTGDEIEYVLLVENAGTAPVTGCDIVDILPSADFVILRTGIYGGGDFLYVDEAGAETSLTAASDGDAATLSADGSQLVFYVGTGATSSAGGSIDVAKNVKALYRVQVK